MNRNITGPLKTTLSPITGLAFFFCAFLLFFIIISFITTLLMAKIANIGIAIRISTVLQDLFIFILPAIITALIMTRLPARFLFVDIAPELWKTILALLTLLVSTPWLNEVIQWNESITFPDNLKELETALREAENTASDFINSMLKGATIGSLIVSVCIVGILAALSEEIFFRGAMLRLFSMTRMNSHLAIWLVALIFSIMHFQFFGFIPRLLLGAYFGYLVWWTKSLWIPIIVHAVNNSVVIVGQWQGNDGKTELAEASASADFGIVVVIGSIILTGCCLYLLRRNSDNPQVTAIQ